MKYTVVAALLLGLSLPVHAGEANHWSKLAASIAGEVARAEGLATTGATDEAKQAISKAYFGLFESEKMEAALRKEVGAKHAFMREKQFGDLRKAAGKGDANEIRAASAALREGLMADGAALDKAGVAPDVFAVNQ